MKATADEDPSSKRILMLKWGGVIAALVTIGGAIAYFELIPAPTYDTQFDKAGRAYDEGRLSTAIDFYTKAIALEPNSADAYYWRGRAYDQDNQRNQAIADYTVAISLKPDDSDAYYFRA